METIKSMVIWIDSASAGNVIICIIVVAFLLSIPWIVKQWKKQKAIDEAKKQTINTTRNQRDLIDRRVKK